MVEIKLTKGKVALIDDSDDDIVSQYEWCAHKKRNVYYATTNIPGLGQISMHRLIMQPKSGEQIDHIDHNGLNNQRNNLRFCTVRQNAMNRRKGTGNRPFTSKFKGVSKHGSYWSAKIYIKPKTKCLGLFKTEKEAAEAYNTAALTHFREFAKLNDLNTA